MLQIKSIFEPDPSSGGLYHVKRFFLFKSWVILWFYNIHTIQYSTINVYLKAAVTNVKILDKIELKSCAQKAREKK